MLVRKGPLNDKKMPATQAGAVVIAGAEVRRQAGNLTSSRNRGKASVATGKRGRGNMVRDKVEKENGGQFS